jgi:gluconolactonase
MRSAYLVQISCAAPTGSNLAELLPRQSSQGRIRALPGFAAIAFLTSCVCARPDAAYGETAPDGIASMADVAPANAVSEPAAPTVAQATAPAVVHRGLAAKVCPPGPFPTPIEGELKALAIPNSEPSALDPKDTEFHLYEGAVWLNGALYFSDFKTTPGFPSRILSYVPGQPLTVALVDGGTNGLALDATGSALVGARHKSKSVVTFSADLTTASDVAAQYQARPFNSPNDVVVRSDGNFYFTDPDFQTGDTKAQPTTNVYRVAPGGQVSVVDDSIANPNGISLSPDERALFVAGNLEHGYVKRYPVAADGSVGEGDIFFQPVTVPDGMVVDCAGNLYVTEHTSRRIRVVAADGAELGRITGFEKNVTNVAFGGTERRTLYITTTGGLYQLELPVPGLPY